MLTAAYLFYEENTFPIKIVILFLFSLCFWVFFWTIIFPWFLKQISPKSRQPLPSELEFVDPMNGKRQVQNSLFDPPFLVLSLVIPAFNEALRICPMLDEAVDYLKKRGTSELGFTYEIIVVDDGSTDDTAKVISAYAKKNKLKELKLIQFEKNRGKGGAVTQGILASSGDGIIFADADGATQFKDIDHLENAMRKTNVNGYCVAIGSRAHLINSEAVVKRSFVRNTLMRIFHFLVYLLGVGNVKDTQCGFKMFSRKAAQLIFPNMHCEGWAFDIESLLIAKQAKIPIAEISVTWHEVKGSKLDLVNDSIRMLKDVVLIRTNFFFYLWRLESPANYAVQRRKSLDFLSKKQSS